MLLVGRADRGRQTAEVTEIVVLGQDGWVTEQRDAWYETIVFEIAGDGVATITLNRPEVMNAFDQRMADEFAEVWRLVRQDDAVRAIVLRASGSGHSAQAATCRRLRISRTRSKARR